jgi:hypothetical protein
MVGTPQVEMKKVLEVGEVIKCASRTLGMHVWVKIKNTVEWCVVNQQSLRGEGDRDGRGRCKGGNGRGRARNKYFDDGVALMRKAP